MSSSTRIGLSALVIIFCITIYTASVLFLHKKSEVIAQERQKIAEMKSELENVHTLKNQVESGKELESTFTKHLVSRNQIVNFIKEVESLGSQTGAYITIDAIDSSLGSGTSDKIVPANFKLSIKGSWNAVMRTLMLVENLPYLGTIGGINFEYIQSLSLGDATTTGVAGASSKVQAGWKVDFNYTFRLIK